MRTLIRNALGTKDTKQEGANRKPSLSLVHHIGDLVLVLLSPNQASTREGTWDIFTKVYVFNRYQRV